MLRVVQAGAREPPQGFIGEVDGLVVEGKAGIAAVTGDVDVADLVVERQAVGR